MLKLITLAFLVAFTIYGQSPHAITDLIPPSLHPGECFIISSTSPATVGPCIVTVPRTSLNATPGTNAITYGQSISSTSSHSAPANKVVMRALEGGETYKGKAADLFILAHSPEGSFSLAVIPHVDSDFAIVEVYYRAETKLGSRTVRLLLHKTQVTSLVKDMPMLCDEIPLDLGKVEKINVRLVSESNVVEFWSDTAETKRK